MSSAAPVGTRLVVAGMDPPRLIHIQDLASLRNPRQQDGMVEVEIGGDTAHVALLEDEAVIVVTVRTSELFELAACIVPLLGTVDGGAS